MTNEFAELCNFLDEKIVKALRGTTKAEMTEVMAMAVHGGVMVRAAKNAKKLQEEWAFTGIVRVMQGDLFNQATMKCWVCNGSGVHASSSGPCYACIVGSHAFEPGTMSLVDILGQKRWEKYRKEMQQRQNRFGNQTPKEEEGSVNQELSL